jgi:hypothetical protein
VLDIANSVRNDDFSNMSIDIYYFDALAVYKNSCGQYCDAAGSGFIIFGQCGYGYSFFSMQLWIRIRIQGFDDQKLKNIYS